MATGQNKSNDGFLSKEETDQLVKTLSSFNIKPKKLTIQQTCLDKCRNLLMLAKRRKPSLRCQSRHPFLLSKETADATSSSKQPVRISLFSGVTSDSAYELWRNEVTCLRKEGYSKKTILNAIRRSFKGEPPTAMMRLGNVDNKDEIL